MAYLSWFYPVVSMTFVQREVAALRARGVEVHTMAIRPAEALLSETERRSAAETWTVLPVRPVALLIGLVRGWARSPRSLLAALRSAQADVPGAAPRRRLKAVAYVVEAVLLAERLRAVRIDHVHVHGGDVGSHVARLLAVLERGRRRTSPFTWSMTVHGPGELLHPAEHLLQAKISDADLVIAISEYGRAQMVALTDESEWPKLEVVHCGIDVDGWPRRVPDAHDGPLRVLTVGRLHPQKSHQVLVDAVHLLRERGVDVAVTLVGDGPTRRQLEQRIAARGLGDRITLTGAVGQSEVADCFREHDVFCLASVSEGLPVVLMEAMAAGLAVVTTRITGVPELVTDGTSGLLVPPARADALADALEALAQDGQLRDRLAREGRAAVRAGFDIADCARQLEGHLRRVRGLSHTPAVTPPPSGARP